MSFNLDYTHPLRRFAVYTYLIGWVANPFEDEYTHDDIVELNRLIDVPADLELVKAKLAEMHGISGDEITIFSFSLFGQQGPL